MGKPPSHAAIPAVSPDGQPPTIYDLLRQIDDRLRAIEDRLAKGDTTMEVHNHRVANLEKIVYGLVGLALTAIAGALIALVVKGGAL